MDLKMTEKDVMSSYGALERMKDENITKRRNKQI